MSVCAQFLSLVDDWSIHLKRGKVVGFLIVPKFSLLLAYRLQNSLTNGKQGLVPEEMFQTLLTNKKQGKILHYQANLVLHVLEEIWIFQLKIRGAPKQLKPAATLI